MSDVYWRVGSKVRYKDYNDDEQEGKVTHRGDGWVMVMCFTGRNRGNSKKIRPDDIIANVNRPVQEMRDLVESDKSAEDIVGSLVEQVQIPDDPNQSIQVGEITLEAAPGRNMPGFEGGYGPYTAKVPISEELKQDISKQSSGSVDDPAILEVNGNQVGLDFGEPSRNMDAYGRKPLSPQESAHNNGGQGTKEALREALDFVSGLDVPLTGKGFQII